MSIFLLHSLPDVFFLIQPGLLSTCPKDCVNTHLQIGSQTSYDKGSPLFHSLHLPPNEAQQSPSPLYEDCQPGLNTLQQPDHNFFCYHHLVETKGVCVQ